MFDLFCRTVYIDFDVTGNSHIIGGLEILMLTKRGKKEYIYLHVTLTCMDLIVRDIGENICISLAAHEREPAGWLVGSRYLRSSIYSGIR